MQFDERVGMQTGNYVCPPGNFRFAGHSFPLGRKIGPSKANVVNHRSPALAERKRRDRDGLARFGQDDDITVLTLTRLAVGAKTGNELDALVLSQSPA